MKSIAAVIFLLIQGPNSCPRVRISCELTPHDRPQVCYDDDDNDGGQPGCNDDSVDVSVDGANTEKNFILPSANFLKMMIPGK